MVANFLSFLRFPLAFLFLFQAAWIRSLAVLLALATDFFDGFIARRFKQVSSLGTILDPIADRFFVLFAAIVLLFQEQIALWMLLSLVSRELLLCLFWGYLKAKGLWRRYHCGAVGWGKVTTVLQLCVLLALVWEIPLPLFIWPLFVACGSLTIAELTIRMKEARH